MAVVVNDFPASPALCQSIGECLVGGGSACDRLIRTVSGGGPKTYLVQAIDPGKWMTATASANNSGGSATPTATDVP